MSKLGWFLTSSPICLLMSSVFLFFNRADTNSVIRDQINTEKPSEYGGCPSLLYPGQASASSSWALGNSGAKEPTRQSPTSSPHQKLEPSCPIQSLLSKARQVATQIGSAVVGMI